MVDGGGGTYEIVLGVELGADWSSLFDGFESVATAGGTVLRGKVVDQTALHGVLARLRDLSIPLLGIRRTHAADESSSQEIHPEGHDLGPGAPYVAP